MIRTSSGPRTTRRIRGSHSRFAPAVLVIALAGCEQAEHSRPPITLEGAWLGEGVSHSESGDKEFQAQMELLSDGTYRWLVLKPAILAMAGAETGEWSREGETLNLTPVEPPQPANPDDKSTWTLSERVRAANASDHPTLPKTLTIADDLSDLRLSDDNHDLVFTPNIAATKKLRETGDVAAP